MNNRFIDAYLALVRRLLPSPLTIALVLTCITALVVFIKVGFSDQVPSKIITWWSDGLWNQGLMVFAMQMMLMLVLGHILALSPAAARVIDFIIKPCTTSSNSALIVSATTMLVGFFNWGLGLIFGAILARKVGEKAFEQSLPINYPLIGAAGYAALLIWHGGLSGSSLIKAAEPGHLKSLMGESYAGSLPQIISLSDTTFSGLNLFTTCLLLIVVPGVLYILGRSIAPSTRELHAHVFEQEQKDALVGAERLDRSQLFSLVLGILILLVCIAIWLKSSTGFFGFFTPNNINLLLLGLCFVLHPNIQSFLKALEQAIQGASGILVQFPLYFGILGLMSQSGLIADISAFFIQISNETTYPIITFISAGLVNVFVPSGGGQWAIQGPIIIQSSNELGIPLYKSILALAYGDEVTNMLQPFWALPLLGITRLSAKDILPYTLIMFLSASAVFVLCLMVF